MFEVMMMMVLRKSTPRPLASVSLPSSRICSRILNTSGWAFSTRPATPPSTTCAARLRSAARLLHSPRSREVLPTRRATAWRSMNSDMSIVMISMSSLPNMNSASALASSALAHSCWSEEDKAANGSLRIFQARPCAADGAGDRGDGLLLPDHAAVDSATSISRTAVSTLPGRCAAPGMPVHIDDDFGDILFGYLQVFSVSLAPASRLELLPVGFAQLVLSRNCFSRSRRSAASSYCCDLIASSFSYCTCSMFLQRLLERKRLATGPACVLGRTPHRSSRSPCQA